jgi:acyl carrier protein
MGDIREKIVALIAEVNPAITVAPQDDGASLMDLGLDSLDHATVLLQVEEAFGIKIPDEETEKLISVQSLVSYVTRNGPARS